METRLTKPQHVLLTEAMANGGQVGGYSWTDTALWNLAQRGLIVRDYRIRGEDARTAHRAQVAAIVAEATTTLNSGKWEKALRLLTEARSMEGKLLVQTYWVTDLGRDACQQP
jgi:hypothetical protein